MGKIWGFAAFCACAVCMRREYFILEYNVMGKFREQCGFKNKSYDRLALEKAVLI
jgi:hypothetical protein